MIRKYVATAFALLTLAASIASAKAPSMGAVKNIVLVHGALSDGSQWRKVYDILVKDGYKVSIVQQPLSSLKEDVTVTQHVLDRQDGSVVLVGHSYGGAIISAAGVDPKVKALVYVAAFQPDTGESMNQLRSSMPAPKYEMKPVGDGFAILEPSKFAGVYAGDLPKAESDYLSNAQVPIALNIFDTKLPAVAWHDKPVYGIVATQDHGISPDLQRWMYKRSSAKVTEIKSSHAVMISQPKAVAKVIKQAASEVK